jgi:hypothetical protein
MTDPKEKAAGVLPTPEATNVVLFTNQRSVPRKQASDKPGVSARRPDCDSPDHLLSHAWALLPIRAKGSPLTRFMLRPSDTQASRTYVAELMPDLSLRIVDSQSGQVVATSAPLAPKGWGA